MLIDPFDPAHRDEMVMLPVGGALLGEFDSVGTFKVIDLTNRLLVG